MNRICCVFILIASYTSVFAQTESIASDDYWKSYNDALINSRATPQRHRETTEWYKSGVVADRWISVFDQDANGNTRFRIEMRNGKKLAVQESISVAGVEYCKKGSGRWSVTGDCGIGANISSIDGNSIETFTKERTLLLGKKAMLLRAYTRIGTVDSNGKQSGRTAFNENKVWISDDNLILKREYITGFLPKKLEHAVFETYDYQVKIAPIAAPIK